MRNGIKRLKTMFREGWEANTRLTLNIMVHLLSKSDWLRVLLPCFIFCLIPSPVITNVMLRVSPILGTLLEECCVHIISEVQSFL